MKRETVRNLFSIKERAVGLNKQTAPELLYR